MIELQYALIPDAVQALTVFLGEPFTVQNGRNIGLGAVSKAKWMGPGWIVWTDHFRTADHGTTVRCFLSFEDAQNETVFRLKHNNLIK